MTLDSLGATEKPTGNILASLHDVTGHTPKSPCRYFRNWIFFVEMTKSKEKKKTYSRERGKVENGGGGGDGGKKMG